jgi:hypothetical protein
MWDFGMQVKTISVDDFSNAAELENPQQSVTWQSL